MSRANGSRQGWIGSLEMPKIIPNHRSHEEEISIQFQRGVDRVAAIVSKR